MRKSRSLPLAILSVLALVSIAAGPSCSAGTAAAALGGSVPADMPGQAEPPAASPPAPEAPILDETYVECAIVARVDLEGGFWGLVTVPDGRKLDPIELPPEFRKDRLPVKIWYIHRGDQAGARMWGEAIDLRRIERRG